MVLGSAPGGDGAGNKDNPTAPSASDDAECQARRRRRPGAPGSSDGAAGRSWVRRLRPAASSSFRSSSSFQGTSADGDEQEVDDDPEVQEMELAPLPPTVTEPAPAQVWPVAFGCVSMAGRMRAMEDAVSLRPGWCNWVDGSPMHFFAVFDGHGGSHVSALCRERMHVILAEELAREAPTFLQRRLESLSGVGRRPWSEAAELAHAYRVALLRAFRRVDALAGLACACGRLPRPLCRCPLSGTGSPGIVGSTAVVALLHRGRIVVANCGDSRAVLSRGPIGTPPLPLSDDHKPDRPDEMVRIEAAGGRVVFNNGARVRGILAMSRAIGDRVLRPEVVCEPEVTITERTAEDECLILASDGMWDVISNETACNVARNCLEDGNPPPTDPAAAAAAAAVGAPAAATAAAEPRCLRAAALLARLAIGRDTEDNISIIVIDLKHRG